MSFEALINTSSNIGSVVSTTLADTIPKTNTPIPAMSLLIKDEMNGRAEMGLIGENFDLSSIGRIRDDDFVSRSGSDNYDAVFSGDDKLAGEEERPRKKKYHRHTPYQTQELESFFKECPHPDEKQRLDLSRRLRLESKQIKFWFQNKRTQMKTHLERHENVILRQENDKLRAENDLLKHAMRSPVCNSCGGLAVPGEVTYEQQQLRFENERLKDEVSRICALTDKFLGRPFSSSPIASIPQMSHFESINVRSCEIPPNLPVGFDYIESPSVKPVIGNEIVHERSMLSDLGVAAMDELIKLVDSDSRFWVKSLDSGKEKLNQDEYRSIFASDIGMKSSAIVTDATRETGLVIINSLALVEVLMDANRWAEMFPSVVARASTIYVVSSGTNGTKCGGLQVMEAEFQVLSPLVPTRAVRFIRFCKQHGEGTWAVVDVSYGNDREDSNVHSSGTLRILPSGCVLQDMANGYSKVTWVEHLEYDETSTHRIFRPVLSSGAGLGAQRWLATLQRHCESLATLLSSSNQPEDHTGLTQAGTKSILQLTQRMTFNFYAGISASSVRKWDKLLVGSVGEDMKILTRKNVYDPGEPSGVVLSVATSVLMPTVTQKTLFDFLRDGRTRTRWDILSNGGPMQEMIRVAKGQDDGNCVSLFRTTAMDGNESSMLILQETWNDPSGALIVYAPVDVSSMNAVMNGGDSAYVALLPSGFAILPDGSSSERGIAGPTNSGGFPVKPEADGNIGSCSGCILTVGFQILVNSLPTAKLSLESVETVNNLISCTIQKIKAAVQ